MRLMGNMGFISWEFMTGELLNINWKKLESLRITGDNSVEYTCEKVCYALNISLGWPISWWRAARKNPKVSSNMAGRWICPRHGHLSGLYWDSYLLLIIIPGFGRSEVVIIYRYLYMGKTWNWMGDFPVSHVWLQTMAMIMDIKAMCTWDDWNLWTLRYRFGQWGYSLKIAIRWFLTGFQWPQFI